MTENEFYFAAGAAMGYANAMDVQTQGRHNHVDVAAWKILSGDHLTSLQVATLRELIMSWREEVGA